MKEQDRNLEHFDDLDKLEPLKQEYNNIPVPEAAKARIMAGINEGKRMSENPKLQSTGPAAKNTAHFSAFYTPPVLPLLPLW